MASASSIEPWSTVRTPARIAALMPSVPWAWAATVRPQRLASVTAALISSSEYDCCSGGIPLDSIAPVTSILMWSAPCLKFVRTALTISSGPSARFWTMGTSTNKENWRASPAPPVGEM